MGFAEAWTHAAGALFQPPTPRDKLDTMDTIRLAGNSVHTVHSVHRVLTPGGPVNSVHTVHIVHRGSTPGDLGKGASAPGHDAGLDWSPWPAADDDPDFDGKWAAFDLRDLCHGCGLRIVRAGERVLAVYPPSLDPGMIEYAEGLLSDARAYLTANLDRLPLLNPAEAVVELKEIMRQHKGLRFCRGEGGSRWPIYPKTWTAGQKQVVQSLWFAAGDALDRDDFMEVDQ